MKIYLNNAATAPLNNEVFKTMEPYFLNHVVLHIPGYSNTPISHF